MRALIGLALVLGACEGGGMVGKAPDVGQPIDAGAADTECARCVIEMDSTWHVSAALDYYTHVVRGVLPGVSNGDVCYAKSDGVFVGGKWIVGDTGAETGFTQIMRSDAPLSCK